MAKLKRPKRVQISINLNHAAIKQIEALAAADKRKRANYIEHVINQYLAHPETQAQLARL